MVNKPRDHVYLLVTGADVDRIRAALGVDHPDPVGEPLHLSKAGVVTCDGLLVADRLASTDRNRVTCAACFDGRRDDPEMRRIMSRLRDDTGADIEDIVAKLMGFQVCFACSIEEQDRNCWCWLAHKLGRRLQRLVDRAQGTREPGDHPAPQRDVKPRSLR